MSTVLHPNEVAQPKLFSLGAAGIRMSLDELRSYDPSEFDDAYRFELVRGVLVVSPRPVLSERDPNEELGTLLRLYERTHPQGASLNLTIFEQEIATLPDTMRYADRAIWAGLGRDPYEDVDIPTILVELVSAGKKNWKRDYETKRDEYLAIGVKEYWIFDRFQRQMTVFKPNRRPKVVKENQSYETSLLPGFVLELKALLHRADKWSKKKRK
jgi:Uma2 family endonuclease